MPDVILTQKHEANRWTFPDLPTAQRFIATTAARHYEIWNDGELIEYGRTPTRIARQGAAE